MTQEEIIEMARQCGFERLGHDDCDLVCYPEEVEAFAKLVAQHEREACLQLADSLGWVNVDHIRARGQA
jgi:hypothetical protein